MGKDETKRGTYLLMFAIILRAVAEKLTKESHITLLIDIEHAHHQFSLDLQAMLDSDTTTFAHDFCGIVRNINRDTGEVENDFLPRCANGERG